MARPASSRRPTDGRTTRLDRSARRHVPTDPEPTVASRAGPAAAGPAVPATAGHPNAQATIAEVTPTAFWSLLPAAERERLGLRLSQLVLKAVRPLAPTFTEDFS